jgi:hypothetical protein
MKEKINQKNKTKAEFIIESKINSFIKKNNGNCYIFFFDKEKMLSEYTNKVIKQMIKDTIEVNNFNKKEKEVIEYKKKKLLIFNINDYDFSKEYLKETFKINELPFMLKIIDYQIISLITEFIYIDKIEE